MYRGATEYIVVTIGSKQYRYMRFRNSYVIIGKRDNMPLLVVFSPELQEPEIQFCFLHLIDFALRDKE